MILDRNIQMLYNFQKRYSTKIEIRHWLKRPPSSFYFVLCRKSVFFFLSQLFNKIIKRKILLSLHSFKYNWHLVTPSCDFQLICPYVFFFNCRRPYKLCRMIILSSTYRLTKEHVLIIQNLKSLSSHPVHINSALLEIVMWIYAYPIWHEVCTEIY